MLVVTTMLTSIANDLPRTAGIKYIDIWMLFCLLIPVMEIILHTIEDHFIRKYEYCQALVPSPVPQDKIPEKSYWG